MPRRADRTENYEPQDSDRLNDFIDTKSAEYRWPENPSAVLLKFKDRIGWVYKAGYERGLCNGEITQIININFGYYPKIDNIPWGKMHEVREWLINNAHRNFQILEPEKHKILMNSDNPYSQDFKKHEAMINREPRTNW